MNLDQPVRDFTVEPAMSEDDGATAIAYGMMAVEPGVDLLAIGAMGIGSTTAAAALACALFGGDASAWSDSSVASESGAVRRGVALHRDAARDPLDLLCRLGGREFAAIVGAALAARRARVTGRNRSTHDRREFTPAEAAQQIERIARGVAMERHAPTHRPALAGDAGIRPS